MLSLTNRNYKDCIPPPRRFMAPLRDRKMGYGIPLTHQNVRWSQFFADYMENLPKEKRTEDYIELAPLASSAARMMCARASMIWEPSELHLGSTGGYLLSFADNTGDNSAIPPPDVVAQIQKEITLENDTIVGWYIIRG